MRVRPALDFGHQRGERNAQRRAKVGSDVERRVALAALQEPDVGAVQASALGERLLREARALAPLAQHQAEDGRERGRSHSSREHGDEARMPSTDYSLAVVVC